MINMPNLQINSNNCCKSDLQRVKAAHIIISSIFFRDYFEFYHHLTYSYLILARAGSWIYTDL